MQISTDMCRRFRDLRGKSFPDERSHRIKVANCEGASAIDISEEMLTEGWQI